MLANQRDLGEHIYWGAEPVWLYSMEKRRPPLGSGKPCTIPENRLIVRWFVLSFVLFLLPGLRKFKTIPRFLLPWWYISPYGRCPSQRKIWTWVRRSPETPMGFPLACSNGALAFRVCVLVPGTEKRSIYVIWSRPRWLFCLEHNRLILLALMALVAASEKTANIREVTILRATLP